MNPVLILTHNNLALTKRCVESLRKQTVDVDINIFDNGSTDGTPDWCMQQHDVAPFLSMTNVGVSKGWNNVLNILFREDGFDHVLVVGNDTVLPPWFYAELLSYDLPFVTGVAVDTITSIAAPPTERKTEPHPDFSAFLIRRDCWENVGPFDETMELYVQDCDFHVRAHRAGIELMKASVPYYHERSSTLRNAPPQEQRQIHEQANRDRATFRAKYGCIPGEAAYEDLFR
ncbi:MAG TPA: glycosyltransferase [Candidatus Sulfotelmatobacter sp.]